MYRVFHIQYGIDIEDVMDEFDESEYTCRADLLRDCEGRIAEIEDSLPTSMLLDIPDDVDPEDVDDALSDAISEKTGWLVSRFQYERVDVLEQLIGTPAYAHGDMSGSSGIILTVRREKDGPVFSILKNSGEVIRNLHIGEFALI